MARFEFGAGVADFVVAPIDGQWTVGTETVVTFWDEMTEGAQYTDLLDATSAVITSVTSDASGALPRFYGPDTVTGMWADAGGTTRAWMDAHSLTGSSEATPGSVRDWLNVRDYGAIGDNVADDTAAIQAALSVCPMGGIVYLPAGAYRTSAPLTIPPAVTLMGTHVNLMTVVNLTDPPCYIRPLATFAGAAVIQLLDEIVGGYNTISAEHRILNVMIDGTDLEDPGIDGIQAAGNIQNVGLRDVTIRRVTGAGINTQANGGFFPYSWRLHRVMVDNVGWHGFAVQVMTDITMIDCQAIGCGASGFDINNAANSQMIGCRAEWNVGNGIHITGDWAAGTGSGGMLIGDCSTDRNGANGLLVDATGNPPIQIENLLTRRDGRNDGAGGGNYAGLAVDGATVPVIVGLVTCYPGTDDNGTQENSPQFGARFTDCAYVSVASGFLHAEEAGWSDGGGNAVLRRGLNIAERTGTTAAPVDVFAVPTDVAGNLNVGGYAALASGQSAGQWNIWDGQAKALNLGGAGGGIAIAEGANARMGVATLAAGTRVVANTSVTANTRVATFRQAAGGTLGHLSTTKVAGTSFTIDSSSASDTSVVAWVLFEVA
ncbi:right-handed parallel beta-helix repeat-containing protein [Streptomyces sp. MBT56]|uniref:right-handed parallel beta-helix repeat-containing protein n=1 Tax=unclassified Streptomyces TaxID=2593676 RepID=UPI00190AB927|nr:MULTISPECIES: right-handed parallel beta-helix repeat-containing protein [unclassified Streptomyces]MBK3556309.1 right-handed parallel beta-helix repeat-containing protein [Streptomyces sp. MBT56]MBK3601225.1 right-handed parallel beta-helix repeat-containing protein [Streptomyces sp. MBT54]MBK3614539.1 right-handed parallel beta-helix repeat-containing protein [Streptomyces sp. MBT98]MBK6042816.1 right-handed parallel beta-helix repeat-containing protein [Streptomyces sp. MBT55]